MGIDGELVAEIVGPGHQDGFVDEWRWHIYFGPKNPQYCTQTHIFCLQKQWITGLAFVRNRVIIRDKFEQTGILLFG
jgi:hypothetical protein